MILAGDIGGTKTALALFEPDGDHLRQVRDAKFPSRDHATFDEILPSSSARRRDARSMPPASASPARSSTVGSTPPTSPGRSSRPAWSRSLDCEQTYLLNDLEASAYAMPHLPAGAAAHPQLGGVADRPGARRGDRRRDRPRRSDAGLGRPGLRAARLRRGPRRLRPPVRPGGRPPPLPPRPVQRPRQLRAGAVRPRPVQHLLVPQGDRPRPRARLARRPLGRGGPEPRRFRGRPGAPGHELRDRASPLRLDLRRRGGQPRAQGVRRRPASTSRAGSPPRSSPP